MRGWAACHSASAFRRCAPQRPMAIIPRRGGRTSVNIIDKTESKGRMDLERCGLRRFLAELPPEEIETRNEPIDLAAVAAALDGNPRAVHFRAVGAGGAGVGGT